MCRCQGTESERSLTTPVLTLGPSPRFSVVCACVFPCLFSSKAALLAVDIRCSACGRPARALAFLARPCGRAAQTDHGLWECSRCSVTVQYLFCPPTDSLRRDADSVDWDGRPQLRGHRQLLPRACVPHSFRGGKSLQVQYCSASRRGFAPHALRGVGSFVHLRFTRFLCIGRTNCACPCDLDTRLSFAAGSRTRNPPPR